ncbi:MAG: c-type cytochrome [Bacteroidia bacterium]|nr:c-type cytochrome [Bacteroidia bacterium]
MKNKTTRLLNKKSFIKNIALLLFLLLATPLFSAEVVKPKSDVELLFSNSLFTLLVATIVILLIVIYFLKRKMEKVTKQKIADIQSSFIGKVSIIVFLLTTATSSYAQEITPSSESVTLPLSLLLGMLFIIATEIFVIIKLLQTIQAVKSTVVSGTSNQKYFSSNPTTATISQEEDDLLLDHNYDGIRELDNDLPPWWKYGFYLTIIYSFIYMFYYHTGNGKGQIDEYNQQIADAKVQVDEYRKKSGNAIDETNAKILSGADITAGKEAYDMNCAACHGKLGEGTVGPNLTDDYWLHGGSINDVFKTIKYGYPEKGMKSWQADLSPLQINQVSSYIKSLHGTNPPNAKEKQGDVFKE